VCDPGQFRVLLVERCFYDLFIFSWGICVFIVAVAGLSSYVIAVVAVVCVVFGLMPD
jgi:hypothetical protein